MTLIHAVYVSAAASPIDEAALTSILAAASRNNTRDGITGMLLYANGMFMQVLEGEESVVDRTLARIRRDRRHSGLILIERREIEERSFGRWHMGFRRMAAQDALNHPHFVPILANGFDPAKVAERPGVVLSLLRKFAMDQGVTGVRRETPIDGLRT